MDLQQQISERLSLLNLRHVEVHNDSHYHQGPNNQSHFKVLCVGAVFEQMPLIKRHRLIYAAVGKDILEQIHALQINAWTPDQWQQNQHQVAASSTCVNSKS